MQKIKKIDAILEDKIEQKTLFDKELKLNQIKMKEIVKIQNFNHSIGGISLLN